MSTLLENITEKVTTISRYKTGSTFNAIIDGCLREIKVDDFLITVNRVGRVVNFHYVIKYMTKGKPIFKTMTQPELDATVISY